MFRIKKMLVLCSFCFVWNLRKKGL